MSSSRSFPAHFREFNARERLIVPGDTVLAAVSGGVDSMVLLELLVRERGPLGIAVEVVHVNHGLRGGESDDDEAFVRERAGAMGLPCHVAHVDTRRALVESGGGVQLVARRLRYEFFASVRNGRSGVKVATAHHADDNAETVLMNLFRGAGPRGLAGIPVRRDDQGVVRPLLFAERTDIEAYAEAQGIGFRRDRTNDGDEYTRNVVRRHVLPLVRERVSPAVARTLLRESGQFRRLAEYLDAERDSAGRRVLVHKGTDGVTLAVEPLAGLHAFLRTLVVREAIEECTGRPAGSAAAEAVAALVRKPTGTLHTVAGAVVALRDRDTIVLRPAPADCPVEVRIGPGGEFAAPSFLVRIGKREGGMELLGTRGEGEELVDADLVPGGMLVLRSWRPGDVFMPLGMHVLKKVSDYFVGARVPRLAKGEYPLLTTLDGRVVCLCGQRVDERFKVTGKTRRVLSILFRRTSDHADSQEHHEKR
jgi:tRNA(Ile)-lysidine synthase